MSVHPSGYYAWKASPHSLRAREDQRLLGQIKRAWLESGGVYGYRKVHDDLRALGERCGKHRVARLMKQEGLHSQTGYHRRPGHYRGRPAVVAPNHLQRQFTVEAPNKAWVTDITYIRTHNRGADGICVSPLAMYAIHAYGEQRRRYQDKKLPLRALLQRSNATKGNR